MNNSVSFCEFVVYVSRLKRYRDVWMRVCLRWLEFACGYEYYQNNRQQAFKSYTTLEGTCYNSKFGERTKFLIFCVQLNLISATNSFLKLSVGFERL